MMDILDRDDDAQRHCDADQAMGLRPSACFVQLGSVCSESSDPNNNNFTLKVVITKQTKKI